MPLTNTLTRYGSLARGLHWLTALLILSAIGLGLYADNLPHDTSQALAQKAQVFSWHKTLGISAFAVAVLRILWALSQPHPVAIHPDRRLETVLAEAVHWSLYLAMLMVPLSGWVHHAAVDGFAPILWPLGQGLPFVPKSVALAEAAGALHWLFSKILIASLLLHVAGALKHALIDRDGVLSRMTRGRPAGNALAHARHSALPGLLAVAIFVAGGLVMIAQSGAPAMVDAPPASVADPTQDTGAPQADTASNWQVQDGELVFAVQQMGARVEGKLPAWTAQIRFDEIPADGRHGRVEVRIDTTQLVLGSVTDQARGPEFFDVANHPVALFEADLVPAADGRANGYDARGSLTLRGVTLPLTLPFTLEIDGDRAEMAGSVTLDRRDFDMGASYGDEASVGFSVEVAVKLTATRR